MKTLMTCAVSALALFSTPALAETTGADATAHLNELQLVQLGGNPAEKPMIIEAAAQSDTDAPSVIDASLAGWKSKILQAHAINYTSEASDDKPQLAADESIPSEADVKPAPTELVFETPRVHPDVLAMLNMPALAMTSSEENPDTIETQTGYGGIYYESEEDVARDAVLTPEDE